MDRIPSWARPVSRAFLAATLAALLIDALLQAGIGMASVTSASSTAPWWATAHLVERGRWVMSAIILSLIATRSPEGTPEASRAWRATGIVVIAAPILWGLAGVAVTAILFTLAGRWDIDGRVFLEPGYYRALLVAYVPWLLGGTAVMAASRHIDR